MNERPRWVGDLIRVGGVAALFGAVSLLPPDPSLAQVKQAGVLRLCVPTLYPPLVTGKPDAPGFDIEFAQAIAKRLDVRIVANANAAMGRDFNPRNWNVTRAQCQVLAGGPVASGFVLSFHDSTPPHLPTRSGRRTGPRSSPPPEGGGCLYAPPSGPVPPPPPPLPPC